MQNPFQQAANNNLNDPLAFVKKLWGDMQLPGMVTPTLSVDELDKQIKDLKTVESWLNVNMNMLKGTIQALEVQRATISALKTMGESFAKAGNATSQAATAHAADTSHAGWPMHGNTQAATSNVVPEPSVEENEEDDEDDGAPEEERLSAEPEQSAQPASAASTSTANSPPDEPAPFHNPAAWWTVLQDQFKQALSHAMKDEAGATSDQRTPVQAKRTAKASNVSQSAARAKSGSKTSGKVTAKTPVAKAKLPAKNTQKVAAKVSPKTLAKASTKKPTKSLVKSRAT